MGLGRTREYRVTTAWAELGLAARYKLDRNSQKALLWMDNLACMEEIEVNNAATEEVIGTVLPRNR